MGANPRPWLIVVAFTVVFMDVFFIFKFISPFAPSPFFPCIACRGRSAGHGNRTRSKDIWNARLTLNSKLGFAAAPAHRTRNTSPRAPTPVWTIAC